MPGGVGGVASRGVPLSRSLAHSFRTEPVDMTRLASRRRTTGICAARWCKSGVFDRVLNHLASDADAEYVMIDATIIRAHQHSAGARKKGARTRPSGRSRGGLTSKIHALADALGNPVRLIVTGVTSTMFALWGNCSKASLAARCWATKVTMQAH